MNCITADSTLIFADSTLITADDICLSRIKIGAIKILISECIIGVYLRWWFNGWHYFNFTNGYEIQMKTENMDIQTTKYFSVISKIERPTRLKAKYSYKITLQGITAPNIGGFTSLLMAEKVEQYEGGIWREVELTRGSHLIRDTMAPGYILDFEIWRRELPVKSAVFQKSLKLYIGNILCDLDDDEVVPINKQTNDIAEMQDRQSDFTATFKIRKTRAMRALFELSGEINIGTDFPFEEQTCKLIQDSIEIITNGIMILDNVDEQYYYVSILSGNKSFFKSIENLKLTDLLLPFTNHTWNIVAMNLSQNNDLDYVYPLCDPSDDGGILADTGDEIEVYGGYIWPFIKVKTIWDEIFANAGYYCSGEILTNEMFLRLFIPIVNRKIEKTKISTYHYWMSWTGRHDYNGVQNRLDASWSGGITYSGSAYWRAYAEYDVPMTGDYTIFVGTGCAFDDGLPNIAWIFVNGIEVLKMTNSVDNYGNLGASGMVTVNFGDKITFYISKTLAIESWKIAITDIEITIIDYGSPVTPHVNLPDISQTDFIKMICNMFGLIPEVIPREHKIKFWDYNELYDNIPIARDWSAYLSEREDDVGFKFGDYAQHNLMKYKESDDVIKDNGMGIMQIDDETLPYEKEVINLPISTCDEVTILNNIFSVNVSRINFNTYNADISTYDQNESIDPRIVYVERTKEIGSPSYKKKLIFSPTKILSGVIEIDSPKKASSLEVSFSYLVTNYSGLSRLLTKTNLRRAKFNLPVYEVAGLKHYIPIYLSQYKAYFYVNKINNYVPGQLCIIDLIKL